MFDSSAANIRKRMTGSSTAFSSFFLLCLVVDVQALSESLGRSPWQASVSSSKLASGGQAAVDFFQQYLFRITRGKLSIWEMMQITALCGAIPGIWYLQRQLRRKDSYSSSKSTSKLNKGVAVNEDEAGNKLFQRFSTNFVLMRNRWGSGTAKETL
jgi:hypothetical protein